YQQPGATGYQPGATGYQAGAPTAYQREQPGHPAAATAYQAGPTAYGPAGGQPAGRAARRAEAGRATGAGGRKRRLRLPVLLVLLVVTVVVCALITRQLAGSSGSGHAASSVTQWVTTGSHSDGIVVVEAKSGV